MTPDDLRFEDRRRIMPVAQHEAGHFVAARVLGFRTVSISVEMLPNGGHNGGAEITLSEPLQSLGETMVYLRRRVQVLYAGALAQTLRENAPRVQADQEQACKFLKAGGAEQDYAKARELMRVLRNIQHSDTEATDEKLSDEQLAQIERDLWAGVVNIVEENGVAITRIANLITSKMTRNNQKAKIMNDDLDFISYVKALGEPPNLK
jgi:hypothetical protein